MAKKERITRRCLEQGCERQFVAQDRCKLHYRRARASGGLDLVPRPSTLERFTARVDKSGGSDACWPYMGHRDNHGYGLITTGKAGRPGCVVRKTHRYAWELAFGPISDGLHVCHRCDNPPCCNPSHLFLGTAHDNMSDCAEKGRHGSRHHPGSWRGERNSQSKLTEDEVREIRRKVAAGARISQIAREHSISTATVHDVRTRRWKHVV